MSDPSPQKPERLIPILIAIGFGVMVLGGMALWHRQGLAVWLEQAIAFCI